MKAAGMPLFLRVPTRLDQKLEFRSDVRRGTRTPPPERRRSSDSYLALSNAVVASIGTTIKITSNAGSVLPILIASTFRC